jgi:hypothetical protein
MIALIDASEIDDGSPNESGHAELRAFSPDDGAQREEYGAMVARK